MNVNKATQDQLLAIIAKIGTDGATITQIEKHASVERHTLSKYLTIMEGENLIYHKNFGKAKVWFINKAPLQTVFNAPPEKKTYAERILSLICDKQPTGLVVIDHEYNIQFMNMQILKTYQKPSDNKLYTMLGLQNPLKLKGIAAIIDRKKESDETTINDGHQRTIIIRSTSIANPDKSVSIIIMIEDITERRKAEQTIQEQKMLLEAERHALNNAAIVAETDLNGIITYVNDKFVEISKYSREELLGKTHRIINSSHHPKEFFNSMWKEIARGKVWRAQIKNKAKDGSHYWVDTVIAPVLKEGRPIKYIAIRFDITEKKTLEKKIQKQRIKK